MSNNSDVPEIDFKQELTLVLTVEEINMLVKALSDKPFREVYEIIGKINIQSNKQLQQRAKGVDSANKL